VFAYVDLETDRLPDRLVVPTESVLVRQGRDLVFVIEGGRAQWTYVTTGRRSGDFVEIIEPLAPGDSVAVSGHHSLSHDARIAVGNVVEYAF
jgi:HlyD family secretion protein